MAGMIFKPTRAQRKLRMALDGPPGSGKTKWGLAILSGLCKKIGVIDTERGSSALYLNDTPDFFDFDMIMLGSFDPRNYIEAIQEFEKEGYDGILIDSASHAWTGKGGTLAIKDKAAQANRGNDIAGWKDATPIQDAFVDAILQSGCHIVMTMRSKIGVTLENSASGNGTSVVKHGLEPIQRAGIEYEFDVVGSADQKAHHLLITKTRCAPLDGEVFPAMGRKSPLGGILAKWLSEGTAAVSPMAYKLPDHLIVQLGALFLKCTELGIFKDANGNVLPTQAVIMACVTKRGVSKLDQLPEVEAGTIIRNLEAKIEEVTYDPLPDKEEVKEEKPEASEPEVKEEAAQEEKSIGDTDDNDDIPDGVILPGHVRPEKAEKGKKSKRKAELAMSAAEAEGRADEADLQS